MRRAQEEAEATRGSVAEEQKEHIEQEAEQTIQKAVANRANNARLLLRTQRFINQNRQELHMMLMLKLDTALLERELYH